MKVILLVLLMCTFASPAFAWGECDDLKPQDFILVLLDYAGVSPQQVEPLYAKLSKLKAATVETGERLDETVPCAVKVYDIRDLDKVKALLKAYNLPITSIEPPEAPPILFTFKTTKELWSVFIATDGRYLQPIEFRWQSDEWTPTNTMQLSLPDPSKREQFMKAAKKFKFEVINETIPELYPTRLNYSSTRSTTK